MVMRTKEGSLDGGSVESEKCKGYYDIMLIDFIN
jgi:hypothetical protein